MPLRAQDALPSVRDARKTFDRASTRFDEASIVHDEARQRLLERLRYVRIDPACVVDLGCAAGSGAVALAEAFPGARVIAFDGSAAMLRVARTRCGDAAQWLRADAERLPLGDGVAGLVFANMLLPWCRPERLFAEVARVLEPSGLFLFSTLGPDSLVQLRRAWASVDDAVHVHGFVDMHDLGDLVVHAGLAEPVLATETLSLTYAGVGDLVRDLRASGGVNIAAGRRRGLTGRAVWQAFERALLAGRHDDRFSITIELILGHAWGAGPRPEVRGTLAEYAVPIERIRRRRS